MDSSCDDLFLSFFNEINKFSQGTTALLNRNVYGFDSHTHVLQEGKSEGIKK